MRKKAHTTRSKKLDSSLVLSLGIVTVLLLVTGMVFLSTKQQAPCANSISCISDLSGAKESEEQGVFMGKTVKSPTLPDKSKLALSKQVDVLADQAGDYKHIYVDLTNQRLYAFEGNNKVMDMPVSTGKWYPTPTGDFRIWVWLRYTRMSGGSGAGYYNLPNVPYTMFYHNSKIAKSRGFSIHGAYWHDNFGQPMSHGCVNMRIADAEKVFYWANPNAGNVSYPTAENPGTLVTVYGKTPKV